MRIVSADERRFEALERRMDRLEQRVAKIESDLAVLAQERDDRLVRGAAARAVQLNFS